MGGEGGEMANPESVVREEEVMILTERRPCLTYPQPVVLGASQKRRAIFTVLGGFIVCLSFGSGMVL